MIDSDLTLKRWIMHKEINIYQWIPFSQWKMKLLWVNPSHNQTLVLVLLKHLAELNFKHHYSRLLCQKSFGNPSNMMIGCSRNIYYYYQMMKTVGLFNIFVDSLITGAFNRPCRLLNNVNNTQISLAIPSLCSAPYPLIEFFEIFLNV